MANEKSRDYLITIPEDKEWSPASQPPSYKDTLANDAESPYLLQLTGNNFNVMHALLNRASDSVKIHYKKHKRIPKRIRFTARADDFFTETRYIGKLEEKFVWRPDGVKRDGRTVNIEGNSLSIKTEGNNEESEENGKPQVIEYRLIGDKSTEFYCDGKLVATYGPTSSCEICISTFLFFFVFIGIMAIAGYLGYRFGSKCPAEYI